MKMVESTQTGQNRQGGELTGGEQGGPRGRRRAVRQPDHNVARTHILGSTGSALAEESEGTRAALDAARWNHDRAHVGENDRRSRAAGEVVRGATDIAAILRKAAATAAAAVARCANSALASQQNLRRKDAPRTLRLRLRWL